MGYFSNGTEGDCYRESYCYRCVNWRDNGYAEGCPIMDMHLLWNGTEDAGMADALDFLITRGEIKASDGLPFPINKQCMMYLPAKDDKTLERLGQEMLVMEEGVG